MDLQAVGHDGLVEYLPDRVGQPRHRASVGGDARQPLFIQGQAVDHGCRKASLCSSFHIQLVGRQDGIALFPQPVRQGQEGGVFLIGWNLRQAARRSFYALANFG